MLKRDEVAGAEHSAWNKIGDDEPVFILRARDVLAPTIVFEWADRLVRRGGSFEKAERAVNCALAMRAWAIANGGSKLPD